MCTGRIWGAPQTNTVDHGQYQLAKLWLWSAVRWVGSHARYSVLALRPSLPVPIRLSAIAVPVLSGTRSWRDPFFFFFFWMGTCRSCM